ncbi:RES family NAD+ phosphorylase [Stutzerimonas urumqiensis]|uniref:RES family NAD+ phosphorylase n=1 Tax=Stutzerimonas urumqiensis TaxID=638269 RepID=UPI000EB470AC|nr:RES family NAD+ phosphorylase [Stutzerimonas urumqiensis]
MGLLDTTCDFCAPVYRNIVSLRVSADLFDDLVPDAKARDVALAAEMRVRTRATGVIERGLAYSEAIGYPFEADTSVASRYGDGTNRVWYGALDEDTALAETCYHQIQMLRDVEGVDRVVTRYRKVWRVQASGLFIDLRAKLDAFPELIADDYGRTQAIGKRLVHEGLPGLLYPSARWQGDCLAAFRAEPLSQPVQLYDLTYRIDAANGWVDVEREPGRLLKRLSLAELGRQPA